MMKMKGKKKNPYKLSKKHDEYFKANKHLWTQGILDGIVPEQLINIIDFNTLEVEQNEMEDEGLNPHYSDLMLTVQLKNPIKHEQAQKVGIIILVEHKSYTDPLVCVQILKYLSLEWLNQSRAKLGKVPLSYILPLLVYHLPEGKNWPYRIISEVYP